MDNTGLLRREAELTLLHPHLGESRRQELRNSPFWPSPLFKSQLVKDGEDFLLKKGTGKNSQLFGPYQNKPFRGPNHNKKDRCQQYVSGTNSSATTSPRPFPSASSSSGRKEVGGGGTPAASKSSGVFPRV